jgi:acetolactate synthase-1/3 small subunit
MSKKSHIISVLVENKPGVLYAVSNLFRRRGFNIESISVGPIEREDMSKMIIVVKSDQRTIEQVVKQLNKLIDVIKVSLLNKESSVLRELALIKANAQELKYRSEIIQYASIFRGRIVDVAPDSLTIELTGDPEKINAFIELIKVFGIKEIARTGITALTRGVINI